MKQKLLCMLLMLLCLTGLSYAQQSQEVSGQVTSASDGSPLAGVSVSVVGSGTATQTDQSGNYSISVDENQTSLSFSYVGFISQTIQLNNRSVINVQLEADEQALQEVVVTALGISRDKKSLGYAAQEVDGETLTAARGGNALQSLSGNVAGATVSAPSSSLGGSTRIVLRGIGSLTGENRPLIVVDGIPMDNSNYNTPNAERGAVDVTMVMLDLILTQMTLSQ